MTLIMTSNYNIHVRKNEGNNYLSKCKINVNNSYAHRVQQHGRVRAAVSLNLVAVSRYER
jgi:hypothetical protein